MEHFLSITSPLVVTAGVAVSLGTGILGVFMILRRMALVADAFSHVALPGIALGVTFRFSPFLGALAFLFGAVFAIRALEHKRTLAPETTLGVIFTAALAIGLLVTPSEELLEALFGDVGRLTASSALLATAGGLALFFAGLAWFRSFTLLTLSPELAHTSDVDVKRMGLTFYLILALAVALGIKFVGVLLMGALLILPAASARNLAGSFRSMTVLALCIAVLGFAGGLAGAARFGLAAGPSIVITLAGVFLLSLFGKSRQWG